MPKNRSEYPPGIRRRMVELMFVAQGCRHTPIESGRCCRDAGVRPSMGPVGDPCDNEMGESYFAMLEWERLDRNRSHTQIDARMSVFEFFGGWYNPHRRHSLLGITSPIKYLIAFPDSAIWPSGWSLKNVSPALKLLVSSAVSRQETRRSHDAGCFGSRPRTAASDREDVQEDP